MDVGRCGDLLRSVNLSLIREPSMGRPNVVEDDDGEQPGVQPDR